MCWILIRYTDPIWPHWCEASTLTNLPQIAAGKVNTSKLEVTYTSNKLKFLFTSTISLRILSKSFLPRASMEAPRDHTHEKRKMHWTKKNSVNKKASTAVKTKIHSWVMIPRARQPLLFHWALWTSVRHETHPSWCPWGSCVTSPC